MNGRTVYDRLYEITDPTPDTTDIDRRMGYWDRWAGQGNPAYEDAANYLVAELESFGLEVVKHRFEFTDIFKGSSCGAAFFYDSSLSWMKPNLL